MPSEQEQAEVRIVAQATAKPGQADALRAALLAMIAPSRAEAGCILYELHEELDKPGAFTFVERWRDAAAFAFHCGTPHFKQFGPSIAGLIVAPPVIAQLKVIG